MTDDIKTGDTIENFRVTSVTTLHEQGETAALLSHGPTGLQWLHFLADDPVSSCAIGIVTPVSDDCGLPHVLEHMVFTGSKKHPGTDLMRGMMNRTVAESMNGCTYPFMTSYFFNSAVESDMRAIFEVWFDAILRPELSDAAFYCEAGRFMPQDASNPGGPLAYTGVVFNEMCRDKGEMSNRIMNEAKRLLVPDSGFGFNHGGCPSAIMSLTPDDVRDYHARWYRPANMRIITRGREMPKTLFAIADQLLAGVEAGETAPPFVPQPRWEEPQSATIYIAPESPDGKSEDEMPNRGVLWLLPDASNPRASLAMSLFTEARFEKAVNAKPELAILEHVHNPRARRLAEEGIPETHYKTMSDHLGPDKCWGIYGHFNQDDTFETFASEMEGRLQKFLDDPETAVKIGEIARRRSDSIVHDNNAEGMANLARRDQFEPVFKDWIFKGDPLSSLVSSQLLAYSQQFERDPDEAVAIVKDLLIGAPHRLDLDIRKAEEGEDPENALIALALKEMRAGLSDEECAALVRREGEAQASLAVPQAGEPLPETTLDDIPADRFAIPHDVSKEPLCGATFLTVKANPSGEAWLTGFADLSDFTSEQLLLIPFITEAFENRMESGGSLRFHSAIQRFTPYAKTGIIDGVQRRGIQFEALVDNENRNSLVNEFATFFHLRDPLTFKKVRKMARFGSDSVRVRQTMLRDKVWATGDTAEASLLNACSDSRALETLLEYRMSCAKPKTPQTRDELLAAFVREASETADLLHNPARWTFALEGPKHLTDPLRESLLQTLLSAPARPIGPVAELKFAPRRQSSEKREAKSVPGRKVATISVSIPAPAESTLFRRRLEIGARLLERDFAEPRIRKGLGAYVARFQWKDNFLRLESRQNPDVCDTLGVVRGIRDFVAGVKWTTDDVRQAALPIAAGFVNQSRSASTLVSRCLENHICGEKPSSIRCELERIAQMKPEEIKETLLEALNAGLGHETISVKASEEAIAEVNAALPDELKLQVR